MHCYCMYVRMQGALESPASSCPAICMPCLHQPANETEQALASRQTALLRPFMRCCMPTRCKCQCKLPRVGLSAAPCRGRLAGGGGGGGTCFSSSQHLPRSCVPLSSIATIPLHLLLRIPAAAGSRLTPPSLLGRAAFRNPPRCRSAVSDIAAAFRYHPGGPRLPWPRRRPWPAPARSSR